MFAVKSKLKNKFLKEKCEKDMANKETCEKFGVTKSTISTGMKCRVFF